MIVLRLAKLFLMRLTSALHESLCTVMRAMHEFAYYVSLPNCAEMDHSTAIMHAWKLIGRHNARFVAL